MRAGSTMDGGPNGGKFIRQATKMMFDSSSKLTGSACRTSDLDGGSSLLHSSMLGELTGDVD